jgi:hypothetical protein
MTKRDQIIQITADLYALKRCNKNVDTISYLCSALWIIAKGTRYELDIKDLIIDVHPSFFYK